MDTKEYLKKLLPAFKKYYTIKEDAITPPFSAQAVFSSHNEQYFLVKQAKIADIDSNDYVYFAETQKLTEEELNRFVKAAWDDGMAKVHPYNGHRNSDVTLIIIADSFEENIAKKIKKTKLSKTYKLGIWGWSNFRLIAIELSSNQTAYNRLGKDLKSLLAK